MIVCICRNVCERAIRHAIGEGAATVRDVATRCGAGTDCGSCRRDVALLIAEQRRQARDALLAPESIPA
jgi:bacterioferritin-associated ferredoxin